MKIFMKLGLKRAYNGSGPVLVRPLKQASVRCLNDFSLKFCFIRSLTNKEQ